MEQRLLLLHKYIPVASIVTLEKYYEFVKEYFNSTLITASYNNEVRTSNDIHRLIHRYDYVVVGGVGTIHIENCSSNIICKLYKVLVQGTHINRMSDGVRSVLLLDCDPVHGIHIHEFGMITAITHSYTRDMGDTTKYTFATLNEEMIYIHNIINEIIRIGLPDIRAV